MAFDYDLPGQTNTVSLLAGSQANNAGSAVLDVEGGNYIGKLAVIVNIGIPSAGVGSNLIVQLAASATNNISNAVAFGANVTAANVAALGVLSADPRAMTGRYLFATCALTGNNTPAFPISITVTGYQKVN